MCGIIGYCGSGNGLAVTIAGLERLEYRGYDSAGVSYLDRGNIVTTKSVGKIANLKEALGKFSEAEGLCIGHTRWATHGEVNKENAHPHTGEEFALVHNGIVENFEEIKKVSGKGFDFKSQTDTEVFLSLLEFEYKKSSDVRKAIIEAFSQIRGNCSFVIFHKGSQRLFGIRRSAPLVVGVSQENGDKFFTSDPYALSGFASKIFFPQDNVLCECRLSSSAKDVFFYDRDLKPSHQYTVKDHETKMDVVDKAGFEHFMLKEIHEQPNLIKRIAGILKSDFYGDLEKINLSKVEYLHIIGCGTAMYAGNLIKKYLERYTQIKVNCELASEFRYREAALSPSEMALFISQSGETADTLACAELCTAKGLKKLSIVNVEGSSLFRESDVNLLIHAGVEIGVASTKAFTQMAVVGLGLAYSLSGKSMEELNQELGTLASRIDELFEMKDTLKKVAYEIHNMKGFLFTGRGEQFPIALEGALKLKEIAYVHAEGYAAGELKHGPISLIDDEMVNLAIIDPKLFDKTYSNAMEVKSRKGKLIVLGEKGNLKLEEIADYFIGLNLGGLVDTQPLLFNIALQLLSYYVALYKGTDIDKPRNLAKSVTVE